MKHGIPALLIVLACCFCRPAQAQLTRFYYYPKGNVYYNVSTKEYIYNHEGNWTPVADLPEALDIAGSPRVVMYSTKPDVWLMNDEHQEQYKNYKIKKGRFLSFRKEEEEDGKK